MKLAAELSWRVVVFSLVLWRNTEQSRDTGACNLLMEQEVTSVSQCIENALESSGFLTISVSRDHTC